MEDGKISEEMKKRKRKQKAPTKLKDKILLTARELGALTGYSVCTLNNHRVLGTGFPYIKIGGAVRYRMKDVLKFIEAFDAIYAEGSERLTDDTK